MSGKIDKWAKWMDVQVRSTNFKPSDRISVLSFLHYFKRACESNDIREGAAKLLFQSFTKNPVIENFAHRVCATNEMAIE